MYGTWFIYDVHTHYPMIEWAKDSSLCGFLDLHQYVTKMGCPHWLLHRGPTVGPKATDPEVSIRVGYESGLKIKLTE